MRTNIFKTLGVSTAALAIGFSLMATPALAGQWHGGGHGGGVGHWHGGGGNWHGGGGNWHGGGGNWHGGGWAGGGGWHGGGWYGGGGGWYGPGWNGGCGWGNCWGPAVGAAVVGGAIAAAAASSAPYYGDAGPAPAGGDAVAYCQSRFKSYNPATGTYLGYDGLRHPCP